MIVFPHAPLEQHTAIVGKTGAGKSSTAKLLIEQVVAEGSRVCILDPIKSDWWGLTLSADGKRPALPFHILGGPRGHLPIHSHSGEAIAEVVANGSLPLSIVDMADFEPGGQNRFFAEFAPRLLRKIKGVVYLVLEEAHFFAPKERGGVGGHENLSIHWAKMLATAGRTKGIRLVLLTQRTQALHNALLGSCDTLIAHRLTAPADQAPIVTWLKSNVKDPDIRTAVEESMSSLKTGEAWFCSGEAKIFERRQFPKISTYDNTKTPTGKGDRVEVMPAAVDLDKLRAIVGQAVKESEISDPKKLLAKIDEQTQEILRLRNDLDGARTDLEDMRGMVAATAPPAEITLSNDDRGTLERAGEIMKANLKMVEECADMVKGVAEDVTAVLDRIESQTAASPDQTHHPAAAPVARAIPPTVHAGRLDRTNTAPVSPQGEDGDGLKPSRQKILDALAWLLSVGLDSADRVQLAFLSDQSPKSGGYANNLGALRSAGHIDYGGRGVVLTPKGTAYAKKPERRMTSKDVQTAILDRLPPARAKILKPLITVYPKGINRTGLAGEAGQSATSGGYANNLGALRSLGVIDYKNGEVVATPMLFIR